MLTDRGRAVLLSAPVLWIVSRILGVAALTMAAVAAVALVVAAVVYTFVASSHLTASRSIHPARLFFDGTASVVLRVRNRGRLPTAILQVEDAAPPALADGARFVLAPLEPGVGATLRYRLHGRHRGRTPIGPLTVRLRDPFGIASRVHRFGHRDEVVVYPPVWRLPTGVPLGGHHGAGGEGRPVPLVSGDELAGVREYVRGDDLRKVHWRSTAHRAKLMIRQDEAPQRPRVALVLDRRDDAHHGVGPASSFEQAVSAAASVAYHFAERNYTVALVDGATSAPLHAVPWQVVLEQLAEAAAGEVDLAGVWQRFANSPAGGVVAAVTAVPDPQLLRAMVRAGRGFAARFAVLVDAESHRGRGRRTVDVAATVGALRAAGWRVTVVGRGDALPERWRDLLLLQRGRAATPAGGAR